MEWDAPGSVDLLEHPQVRRRALLYVSIEMSRDAPRRPGLRRFLGKLTTLSLAKPKVVGLIATTRFGGLDVYCVIEWLKKFSDPHDPPIEASK